MVRLGLIIGVLVLTAGCSTSRKLVVQDGFRGNVQAQSSSDAKRPGALTMAPEAPPASDGGVASQVSVAP